MSRADDIAARERFAEDLVSGDLNLQAVEIPLGAVQHLRLGAGHGDVLPAVAVQLCRRATRLRTEHAALGGGLPRQRLPYRAEHERRELTRAVSAAGCGAR